MKNDPKQSSHEHWYQSNSIEFKWISIDKVKKGFAASQQPQIVIAKIAAELGQKLKRVTGENSHLKEIVETLGSFFR